MGLPGIFLSFSLGVSMIFLRLLLDLFLDFPQMLHRASDDLLKFFLSFLFNFGSILNLFWDHFEELAKQSPFEDAGGATGEPNGAPFEPKETQRCAKGAKREPKGSPTGATFAHIFLIVAGFVLGLFFLWFWNGFGTCFGAFWVVISDTFSEIAEKA